MRLSLFFFFLSTGTVTAAPGETPPPGAADVQFFEAKVRPLLVERCFDCHSSKAKKIKGELLLDSRSGLLKGGESGPAVVPGHPEKSLLVKAIGYKDRVLHMPPNGKLPVHEIAVLEEWIRRGAPIPVSGDAKVPRKAIDLTEGRKFWSFQPPRSHQSPVTKDKTWAKQRIDGFILAELEKNGLTPSPAAERRVLIRRTTFDLLGLPPTPEEVERFVNDSAADAYGKLIDRLLAAPQYGERWARFWLDLARYCDIPEPWAETKGKPYLYRDWVIQAFNGDLPYDQFVQKQLAADLMPAAKSEDRAALGFIGLSPTYWKELKLDPGVIKAVVAEEWEERIHTVASTFLGLTVACARCHDHKFDPITTKDYYGLAGIFASTRPADRALLSDADALQVKKARELAKPLENQIAKLQTGKKPIAPEIAKQIEELTGKIQKIRQANPHFDAPMAVGVEEASLHVLPDGPYKTKLIYKAGEALDLAMQIRGNPINLGPVVPRRFLAVLSTDSPKLFTQGSGRLELAQAIVTEGAPLTARVIVNRVWKHHFGAGLVETPSDFGTQGERPSHPQLLDDLTARFIANGWSLKWLHREILLSATYQQTSKVGQASNLAIKKDPDNRLLWRMSRRRLEVEAWRDAMLAVAGNLNLQRGGPPLDLGDAKNNRRTIYGTIKRRELNDLLRLHDFPDPTTHNPARVPTTTPLQQLFTLNSPFLQQTSAALARRLKAEVPQGVENRVRRAYLLLYGRPATETQIRLGVEFLTEGRPGGPVIETAWEQYSQVLLGSNEFLFID